VTEPSQALLVIDLQIGVVDGTPIQHSSQLLEAVNGLLSKARESGVDVIYIQHDGPKGHRVEVGTSGWPIHPAIAPGPGELVVRKRSSDSFFETDLHQVLQERDIQAITICGAMTEYCVDTTCRRAVSLGYDVTLASDAHGTADTDLLTARQIIDHHNHLLEGFDAGGHEIVVGPSAQITFVKSK